MFRVGLIILGIELTAVGFVGCISPLAYHISESFQWMRWAKDYPLATPNISLMIEIAGAVVVLAQLPPSES